MFNELFKIGNWNVSLNDTKTELKFDNGYNCAYAYFDKKKDIFYFDVLIVPKYVQSKVRNWAKKSQNNIIDIYNS